MAVDLATYVKAKPGDTFVPECAAEAKELVARHIGAVKVPDSVVARAELEVGADLYYRRDTRNGIAGFGGSGDTPPQQTRIARDPLRAAYDILAPWLGPAIA